MTAATYHVLGRSGLRVSPFCLGSMTFGTSSSEEGGDWGAGEDAAREIFNRYVDEGGNFVDTAVNYMDGQSEALVGRFVTERHLRDKIVIGTKFTATTDATNPNASGNGAKSIRAAVETSLRRLGTDYIDLYWMHFWDTVTPAEDVVDALDNLVRAGKILHYGFSNVPAWYLARAHTLAELRGKARPIALQAEYSLVSRYIEREHVPAAQELGLGLCAWSPLASGFLSGKYRNIGAESGVAAGRLDQTAGSPVFDRDEDRNWRLLAVLRDAADELGKPPAQVALSWLAGRPGVTSIILGATRPSQLAENLSAASLVLPAQLRARLDSASEIETISPYEFFTDPFKSMLRGEANVEPWTPSPAE
jgi:aryl-alcohol dehydrogenase-like predicted oxidoreductase